MRRPIVAADGSRKLVVAEKATVRFGEVSKTIPVLCVAGLKSGIYFLFVFVHCMRLLQFELPKPSRDSSMVYDGYTQLAIFHSVLVLILYCYGKCMLTLPGTIPDTEDWKVDSLAEDMPFPAALNETKHTGERRRCKWCLKYKPDRCHHCRTCGTCVLKMDHHCPWVFNCIGLRNHKYFMLLLLYSSVELIFVTVNMFDSLWDATRNNVDLSVLLLLLVGEVVTTFTMVVNTTFLGFHTWLMVKAMTTVEFCEKSLKRTSYDTSLYSLGVVGNIYAVLGPKPLLWLLPCGFPQGDGLSYITVTNPVSSRQSQGNARVSFDSNEQTVVSFPSEASVCSNSEAGDLDTPLTK